ncbi:lyase [Seongchinamella sediminis]|uniref:Lyase n=1 Tax=Seongchinamella sediminis TaxID=2283635 RepID=A0A3L7E379_9GAMM|nr:lyase [Seongchinamella sediminis]RLQ23589.1 lyase [Seongchinamella sediminis]
MRYLPLLLFFFTAIAAAEPLLVTDPQGKPIAQAMVTRTPLEVPAEDLSDDGYAPHGVTNTAAVTITRFTDPRGVVDIAAEGEFFYRVRAQGYQDLYSDVAEGTLQLTPMNQEQYIASYPSNVWLSQLDFGGDRELKETFQLNCAFCHQQASPFMRNERTVEQWVSIIERMNTYGARMPSDDIRPTAELLQQEYRELRENPETVPEPRRWESHLSAVEMTEWPIGDGFSQMHDFLLHPNGYVYVGDNLFDRIYEIDTDTGEYTVYKVPHADDARLGGILGNRFEVFPKMYNYMGVHSFAYSKQDGNIFITPSMQQSLLEFDIETRKFITHQMPGGLYPHTIRTDDADRVWFTMALSSQVAMFDRKTEEFTLFDLPARSIKEWLFFKFLPLLFSLDPEDRPLPSPDRESTGLPMPYGIDVAPDGGVWVARLYANDLAHIDPDSGEVTMIDFPYSGPRRLRADADGNIWVVAFQVGLLVKYDPRRKTFTEYELPVVNELPYALNVDRDRGMVWVNGNQSDTILSFDIASESWKVYPMPRQRFFTRDIEISEEDGAVYTSNSHFPTWQSESATPTLLRITPIKE